LNRGFVLNTYQEGFRLLEEKFGNGKDNLIALGTIGIESGSDGSPRPIVRVVDAYYEEGVFYVTTNAKSNKMRQIAENQQISIASSTEMFTASGLGENLGWVLDPKNVTLRSKLRTSFSAWYDTANNEKDENCCILALRLQKGTLNINHWEKLYHLDFEAKSSMPNGGVF
jgi:hypothetical protein